jgi:hypothetical protein
VVQLDVAWSEQSDKQVNALVQEYLYAVSVQGMNMHAI